jgi:hypothetical protein
MATRALHIVLLTIGLLAPSMAAAKPLVDALPRSGALNGSLSAGLIQGDDAQAPPSLNTDEAAREIQRRHGGRVLSVQQDGRGYRVKVLKNGEVRIYQITP